MALYENTVVPERAVLLSVDTGAFDAEASMEELQELARSAGAQVLATVIQKRPAPDGATCIGEGKLQEIRDYCKAVSYRHLDVYKRQAVSDPLQTGNCPKLLLFSFLLSLAEKFFQKGAHRRFFQQVQGFVGTAVACACGGFPDIPCLQKVLAKPFFLCGRFPPGFLFHFAVFGLLSNRMPLWIKGKWIRRDVGQPPFCLIRRDVRPR